MSAKEPITFSALRDKLFDYLSEILPRNWQISFSAEKERRLEPDVCVIKLTQIQKTEDVTENISKYLIVCNIDLMGKGATQLAIKCQKAASGNYEFFNHFGLIEFSYLTNSSAVFRSTHEERASMILSFYAVLQIEDLKPYAEADTVTVELYDSAIDADKKIAVISANDI